MSGHPSTDACDFIRSKVVDHDGTFDIQVPTISRSQASQVMAAFEEVFGLSHEEMATRLADYARMSGRQS